VHRFRGACDNNAAGTFLYSWNDECIGDVMLFYDHLMVRAVFVIYANTTFNFNFSHNFFSRFYSDLLTFVTHS